MSTSMRRGPVVAAVHVLLLIVLCGGLLAAFIDRDGAEPAHHAPVVVHTGPVVVHHDAPRTRTQPQKTVPRPAAPARPAPARAPVRIGK